MPRIQLKLIAALAGLVLAVTLISGVLAERRLRRDRVERVEATLAQHAALVTELLGGRALDWERRAELDALADRAGRAAGVRVTLIDGRGRVVGDSDVPLAALPEVEDHALRPEVADALGGRVGRDLRGSRTVARGLLYLAQPYRSEGRRGVVRVAEDLSELDAAVASLRRELVAAGAVGLLFALGLSYLLAGVTLRPLSEMRRVVRSIARGELEQRLRFDSGDELADIAHDINRMAEQLRSRIDEVTAEKEQLQAVLGGMVEGVLVVDRGGAVVLANPRLREMFSVWGDVRGKTPLELIRHPAVDEALSEASGGTEPVVRDIELGGAEGRRILVHAVGFRKDERQFLGTVAVFHDVTELRRLETVRRDFVAAVSHELKTPLTAIRGFAETLLGGDVPPDNLKSYLGVILKHANRLESLIEDVLALSRIESRKYPIQPTDADVLRIAESVVSGVEPQIRGRSLSVSIESEGGTVAWADRRAVEQILTNLIDNAVKYTDPGGRIEVRIQEVGRQIRVQVADTGIGIPEADQGRIFERFYRVDKARSRDLGGTGLGLSIVKHLTQAMGGHIGVSSRPGEGSTFTFTLPGLAAAAPEPA